MPVTQPALEFDDVSLTYCGSDKPAIAPLSLAVEQGDFVALVGASGSGKTTLLKMVNRLIEPDTGTVSVDGIAVRDQSITALRRAIGYVFQGVGLFPHLCVADNIAITLKLMGEPITKRETRVTELLELVALPASYATRMPDALSGGERQRIGVARALAAKPKILLMDEPFGALDPITRDDLATATRTLHERLGLTTLMVTHDMQEALLMADRVLVMDQGSLIADASPQTLLAGHPDPVVAAMIAMPKRQAARLSALALANA